MKAILFDLDDTLLDYSGGVDASWQEACAAVVPAAVDLPAFLRVLAETRGWFWSDPERHRRERVNMLGAWRQIAAEALVRAGLADHGRSAAIAAEYAGRRRAVMRLFPDARACLEGLRSRGLPLALVTNGDARQQRDKIERHGLAAFFDAILIEGEFGVGKPEAVVYETALGTLGVQASDACMVGDNLEWDVAAPQRLGLTGVWIDRGGSGLPASAGVRPHRVIRSLAELGGILSALSAR